MYSGMIGLRGAPASPLFYKKQKRKNTESSALNTRRFTDLITYTLCIILTLYLLV